MPGLSTLEANRETALTLGFITFARPLNKSIAVWLRAPLKIRICIDINVFFEFKVFLKDLLRSKLSNVLSCVLSGAGNLRTFNLLYFTICNVESYIVSHAVQAKSMRAGLNTMKVFLVIVIVANITSSTTFSNRLNLSLANGSSC